MPSDADSVISDSDPEYAVDRPREATQVGSLRSARRRTSRERPGLSTGEADASRVLVLLSASEDEGAANGAGVTSSYFAAAATKRRRVPSPRGAGEWAFAELAGLESMHADAPRSHSASHQQPSVAKAASRLGPSPAYSASTSSSLAERHSKDQSASPATAHASASPFVSALNLLRSTSPSQPSETDDELIPPSRLGSIAAQSINSKKGSVAAPKEIRRSISTSSVSSVEIVGPAPRKRARAPARSAATSGRKTKGSVAREDDGDAPGASGALGALSSNDSLPVLSSRKGQLQSGAAGAAPRAPSVGVEGSTEVPTSTARKKPWEEIEAKPVTAKGHGKGKMRQKPAFASKRRAQPKQEVKAETIELDELESDGDDVVIASFSQATKPTRIARKTSLQFLPTPIDLPADDRVRLLNCCPLCSVGFAATKALPARQNHLRSCAAKLDFTASTLSSLVDAQLLLLYDAAEAARRANDDARTLFDIAIGRGQGAGAKSAVHVVGVEEFTGGDPGEWYRATKMVQDEMDLARRKDKKPKEGKLVRVAKEIRRERADAAARGGDVGWTVTKEEDASARGDVVEGHRALLPPATGRLRPETSTARNAVAHRAGAVLGPLGASHAHADDVVLADDQDARFAFDGTPPRPTQVFEPSLFASRFTADELDSSIEVVVQPAAPSTTASPTRVPHTTATTAVPAVLQPQTPTIRSGAPLQGETTHPSAKSSSGSVHSTPRTASPRTSSATEAMRTLGLQGPSRGSPAAAAGADAVEVFWSEDDDGDSGVVLRGGAEPGAESEAEAESSDEEPLASVVRRTSTPRRKRKSASPVSASRAKRVAPPRPSSDDSLPRPPPPARRRAPEPKPAPAAAGSTSDAAPPDYSALSLAALQREVAKYGFRPSKERSVLERQLGDVWRALHPTPSAAATDEAATPPATPHKKTRGRKKKGSAAPADEGERASDVDGDGETVGEKLRRLIIADEALYLRILRYEPVHFDEFIALAAKGGVKVAKPLLSITFYTQDPTGGTRRRYR
ncbi:hypothetical protein JCM3770_005869 [Rhodotorula araucariae]